MSSTVQKNSRKTPNRRLLVCLTGMPGAGKSVAAEVAKDLGFEIFRMGDDVRMEVEKRKIPPTDENLGSIMIQLRQSGGPVAIAILCGRRIERDSKSSFILVDGIRNVNEFHEFKKLGKAVLVLIHTSPAKRFSFLQQRARSDSPATFATFEARDRRELSVGIGEAIALADEVIVNSETLEELKVESSKLFQALKKQQEQEVKTQSVSA